MSISLDCRDGNCRACDTCCHKCHEPLMAYGHEKRADHIIAALGVILGLLTITLAVIGIVILTGGPAHAQPSSPFCDPNYPCDLAETGADTYLTGVLGWTFALCLLLGGFLMLSAAVRRWWEER
jgi:hypothetical protein